MSYCYAATLDYLVTLPHHRGHYEKSPVFCPSKKEWKM